MSMVMTSRNCLRAVVALVLATAGSPAMSQTASDARALEEVRNTVINLLDALVQKGVMTREQAEAMVAAAQNKAAASAQAKAANEAAEAGAVRVTHVPEIVKQDIEKQVREDLRGEVTRDVVAQAKAEGWGVPGGLPDWIEGVRLYGDVRVRSEGDLYASDNAANVYVDFNTVNDRGGLAKAGEAALLNTTADRNRLVGRIRSGVTAQLGNSFAVDMRLASGNIRSPVSTNQTLGNYGTRWDVQVDKAAILWNPVNATHDREFDLRLGRFNNPFVGINELVWDNDLTFEGVSATYAMDLFGNDPNRMERGLFLTVGAFPLQEVELTKDDKWLYGSQLGLEFTFGRTARLRIAGAYYQYDNIKGVRNSFDSTLFDYTAARFMQKGNSLYDIRTDDDNSTNLFALVGDYKLENGSIWLDLGFGATHVTLGGEYVKNIGWDKDKVFALTGATEPDGRPLRERTAGYEVGAIVGHPEVAALWDWRAFLFYRYVERDAVLDAFTDSDFHLGGTDAKGYQIGFDLGLSRGTWLRLRYLTANEIDGPPLGIDVWQVDLNGRF
jgi:polyhydroxyalkanoate synthesis regulator phasin